MNRVALGVALALAIVAALRFLNSESVIVWKITILTTEFGHRLSLVPLALAIFLLRRAGVRKDVFGLAALTVAFITSAILLLPSVQYVAGAASWAHQLESAFGRPDQLPVKFPIAGLVTGFADDVHAKAREFTFDDDTGEPLRLLFYGATGGRPAPWLLIVHGGGWDSGDRFQLPELNTILAAHGIAVVSIDYRLAPKWKWPAPRTDALNAAKFVKNHAAELHVDSQRWAILGRSAGGQIAEAVAFQSGDPTLKGCIALYAPSDLLLAYKYGRDDDILSSRGLLRDYVGGEPLHLADAYRDASPIFFVNAKSPPTLLFHGPHDPLVWVKHSERLFDKLREHGVKSALIEIPWATHAFDYTLAGPGGRLSTVAIEYFLQAIFP